MMIRIFHAVRNLVRRDRLERDLDDELRASFDLLVDEKVRGGMDATTARRAAATELRIESVKEQVRDVRAGSFVETLLQDARYAARLLRRNPLFTLTAAASLAIGIGATTTVFTVANGLLLSVPSGVSEPSRLVEIARAGRRTSASTDSVCRVSVAEREHEHVGRGLRLRAEPRAGQSARGREQRARVRQLRHDELFRRARRARRRRAAVRTRRSRGRRREPGGRLERRVVGQAIQPRSGRHRTHGVVQRVSADGGWCRRRTLSGHDRARARRVDSSGHDSLAEAGDAHQLQSGRRTDQLATDGRWASRARRDASSGGRRGPSHRRRDRQGRATQSCSRPWGRRRDGA